MRQNTGPREQYRQFTVTGLPKVVVLKAPVHPVKARSRPAPIGESHPPTEPESRLDKSGALELPKRMASSTPARPTATRVGAVGLDERPPKASAIVWNEAAARGIDGQQEQLSGERELFFRHLGILGPRLGPRQLTFPRLGAAALPGGARDALHLACDPFGDDRLHGVRNVEHDQASG